MGWINVADDGKINPNCMYTPLWNYIDESESGNSALLDNYHGSTRWCDGTNIPQVVESASQQYKHSAAALDEVAGNVERRHAMLEQAILTQRRTNVGMSFKQQGSITTQAHQATNSAKVRAPPSIFPQQKPTTQTLATIVPYVPLPSE